MGSWRRGLVHSWSLALPAAGMDNAAWYSEEEPLPAAEVLLVDLDLALDPHGLRPPSQTNSQDRRSPGNANPGIKTCSNIYRFQ
eukprot:6479051-Amphidinium_carterae.1